MNSFATILHYIISNDDTGLAESGLYEIYIGFAATSFIISIILLFFGKRLLRLSLGIIGFIFFGSIPFWIYKINDLYISPVTLLIIMLVVGVVAAFIVSYFTKFGVYVIGITSGVQFGILLCEIIYSYSYTDSIILLVVLTILFGLVGILITYYFFSYMAIGITAFNGFLMFRTGVVYAVIISYDISYDGLIWGSLFGSLFVGFLGAFWQNYKYKNYPYLKNMESSQTPDEEC